ncbi:PREDICTED: insulin-like growth factor-binding protein 7 [Condylura cristata]|uniref:insulin-like growth factor-binding protein 7 n=1 Tax=Condylura cristata TaxID=143302 RepID=UPI00033462B5|nr:PREDICTED: insulin-like growth factor-binding protein 7 [Condylura cristata]
MAESSESSRVPATHTGGDRKLRAGGVVRSVLTFPPPAPATHWAPAGAYDPQPRGDAAPGGGKGRRDHARRPARSGHRGNWGARGEGEPCGGGGAGRGHCAPGMECVKSRKRRKGKAGAAAGGPGVSGVCVCKSRYPVCGSDGNTYPSGCQLRAASLRAESRGEKPVTQVSKGTCEQGPSIVTPPKDIWNVTGAQVYLSCEVIGIPTPVLIWNKVKRGHYGVQRTELLPGDRDNLAIQTRGGPEKHEVTGWVLVSPLSKEDAGEYECHASNSQGQASASAKITVVDALHEIPVKKGEGAEL